MFWKLIIVSVTAFHTLGHSHQLSSDDYLLGIHRLVPTFNSINGFDEPYSMSNARISAPVNSRLPSVEQMKYYHYYTIAVSCPYQVRNYIILDNETHLTSAIVALSEKRKEIVVSFRATVNIWNFVLDALIMNATPDPRTHIKIHKGFYIAVMSLYNDVVKTVGSFRLLKRAYKTYKIVLTGYSLGAAMARVTEFYLIYYNQFAGATYEIYTYGEPRSGNKFYADYLNSQNITTARITNRADIVCHMPPTSILGTNIISDNYYHVLNEYWFNGDKSKFADKFTYEDRSCSNSLGPLYSVLDHFSFFDLTHNNCTADFFAQFTAIPNVILPTRDIPPFPRHICKYILLAACFGN